MRRVESLEFASFEWDEAKRQLILEEREIDFLQVAEALLHPHLEEPSDQQGEVRTLAVCMIGTQIVRVIYTKRGEVCRIVTAMAARRNERKEYRTVFG
ncbi:MAG: BrnT family toxin [Mesorhizobium sp.]